MRRLVALDLKETDSNGGPVTIYKKFPENPVGKEMEHSFLGCSSGKFPRATEHLKR